LSNNSLVSLAFNKRTNQPWGEACGVIESVKTVADIHAPASGVVLEVNPALADTPEAVNADPYGAWLFRMKLSDPSELALLLDAAAYEKVADD
jgi:glycine cleavage system H protein